MYPPSAVQLLIINSPVVTTSVRYYVYLAYDPFTIFAKGVQIQEGITFGLPWPLISFDVLPEVLSELHRSQESGYNMRDNVRQHHLNRAKICSKIIKYPHLEDYAVCVLCSCLSRAHIAVVGVKRAR